MNINNIVNTKHKQIEFCYISSTKRNINMQDITGLDIVKQYETAQLYMTEIVTDLVRKWLVAIFLDLEKRPKLMQ